MGTMRYLLSGLLILTSLVYLVYFDKPNLIEMFYDKDSQPTLAQVQSVIKSGADINVINNNDWTALTLAARFNERAEIITALNGLLLYSFPI